MRMRRPRALLRIRALDVLDGPGRSRDQFFSVLRGLLDPPGPARRVPPRAGDAREKPAPITPGRAVTALTFARVWLGCGGVNLAILGICHALGWGLDLQEEARAARLFSEFGAPLTWTMVAAIALLWGPVGLAVRLASTLHNVTKNRDQIGRAHV
jgi:hypothetical protein